MKMYLTLHIFFTVAQFGGIWEGSQIQDASESGIKRQK